MIAKRLKCITVIMLCLIIADPCVKAADAGIHIDLTDIGQWSIAQNSASVSDSFMSDNGTLHYRDIGGQNAQPDTEESGYTVYRDFDMPLAGDINISFKVKCNKTVDYKRICFLSTKINNSYYNSRVSRRNTEVICCEFSNIIRNTTGQSTAVTPQYNYIEGYWYSYSIALHLTGSAADNTADISITNDAADANRLSVGFTDVAINGGGVLGSIVIYSADKRKASLESEIYIKDFNISTASVQDEKNDKITIRPDGSGRQKFNGLGVNAVGAFEIHSDVATKNEMLDKIFRDLHVDKLRIWASMGVYLQKDKNGNIAYDIDATNPYISDPGLGIQESFWYNYERAADHGMMTINDIIEKYDINEILLSPGGLYGDGYKVPQWMRGAVEDPYTGAVLPDMLLPENAPVYGRGLARLIYDVKNRYNITITATSIFNELGGCITDREVVSVIKALRKELDEYGLNYVKILAPEYSTNSMSRLARFMTYISDDPEALEMIYGFANHSYSCAVGKAEEAFLLERPMPLWMTEICEEGELTDFAYSECSHTAGTFLCDLNHMVTDWYYFIGANAVHEDRLFSVGGTLMYSTYAGSSNIIPPEMRAYYNGYTQRPVYSYLKQISDVIPKGTLMTKCVSDREGDMELDDLNDNKLYAAAGETPNGGISVAVLNNTSTEKQQSDFEKNNYSRRFADEVIDVDIDLSAYSVNDNVEFNVVSTSPDGELVDKGKITVHNSKLSVTVHPAELITLVSNGAVKSMYSAGINTRTNNVFVAGILRQPFDKNSEVYIMLAKKDGNGNTEDIAYINSTYPDQLGRYSMKFRLPDRLCADSMAAGYRLYTYHNSDNKVNDYILKVESGGVLDVDYSMFDFGKISTDITNPYGNNEIYKIIVGFYDADGRLINCETSEENDISYDGFARENGNSEQLIYSAPAGTVKVKSFIWGRGTAITPMAECVQILH